MSEHNGAAAHATLDRGVENSYLLAGDPAKGARLNFELTSAPILPIRPPLGRDAADVIEG